MIDEIFEAVFGVDFKIGKTIKDMLLHPVRVAEAELEDGNDVYTPQIKLFIALFGLQLLLLSIFKIFDLVTLEAVILSESGLQAVSDRLQAEGSSLSAANDVVRDWYNYSVWPAALTGSVVYVVAMKLFRPAMKLSAHVKLYLLATNAGFLWMFPFLLIGVLPIADASMAALWASVAAIPVFLGYLIPLFRRFYATSAAGLVIRVSVLAILVVPSIVITTSVAYSMISFGMKRETGLGFFEALHIAQIADQSAADTETPDEGQTS